MYQVHSEWSAEQALHRYDPDRLDRGPAFPSPVPSSGSGTWSRLLAPVTRLRIAAATWIRRGSLGPLPDRCDPVRQGW